MTRAYNIECNVVVMTTKIEGGAADRKRVAKELGKHKAIKKSESNYMSMDFWRTENGVRNHI